MWFLPHRAQETLRRLSEGRIICVLGQQVYQELILFLPGVAEVDWARVNHAQNARSTADWTDYSAGCVGQEGNFVKCHLFDDLLPHP